jgi:hypothetical protein
MKKLTQKAAQVFLKLIEGLNEPGDSKKIDNTNGAFMPVHVELLRKTTQPVGFVFSVAHYYESNGDLVCDPDMTFLFLSAGTIIPMTFEQGGLIYQEAATLEDGKLLVKESQQRDITSFANDWMKNIKEQQRL